MTNLLKQHLDPNLINCEWTFQETCGANFLDHARLFIWQISWLTYFDKFVSYIRQQQQIVAERAIINFIPKLLFPARTNNFERTDTRHETFQK